MPLTVTVKERKHGIFTVSPVGSIDSTTYAILEKEVDTLIGASPKIVVLDMEGVTYMSSMGVRVIFKARRALKEGGGTLVVVSPQPQIKKVFEIVNALPPQEIFESVEELDRYLDRMQRKRME